MVTQVIWEAINQCPAFKTGYKLNVCIIWILLLGIQSARTKEEFGEFRAIGAIS